MASLDESQIVDQKQELDISQLAIDNQYFPITRQDFDKMSVFGSGRLITAVAIKKQE